MIGGGCCASAALAPEFANGKIPTDEIAIAKVVDGVQEVTITVNDQGYSPAVAVVQKGMKTKIKFVAEKLNSMQLNRQLPGLQRRAGPFRRAAGDAGADAGARILRSNAAWTCCTDM